MKCIMQKDKRLFTVYYYYDGTKGIILSMHDDDDDDGIIIISEEKEKKYLPGQMTSYFDFEYCRTTTYYIIKVETCMVCKQNKKRKPYNSRFYRFFSKHIIAVRYFQDFVRDTPSWWWLRNIEQESVVALKSPYTHRERICSASNTPSENV